MIAAEGIQKTDLVVVVVDRQQTLGRSLVVKAVVAPPPPLMARSVLRNCSTCSLAVAAAVLLGLGLRLPLEAQVRVYPLLRHLCHRLIAWGVGYEGVFTASFGPGGFNARRAGGGGTAQDNTPRSLFVQLLPLIILFGFSLLSALPSLFSTPPVPDPHFSFHNTARYSTQRQTVRLGVPYFVNQGEFQKHPVIGAELAREGNKVTSSSTARGPALQKFEEKVDHVYTQDLYVRCQRGVDQKNRLKENEIGLFGIGTDWAKVKKIEEERIEECDKLKSLGII